MYTHYCLKTNTMQSCAQTIRRVFKVIYTYILTVFKWRWWLPSSKWSGPCKSRCIRHL